MRTKEIVDTFGIAIRTKDICLLLSLLEDNGAFHIQETEDFDIQVVSDKNSYVNWLAARLDVVTVYAVDYNLCQQCRAGNPVVLINEGYFPKIIKDSSEKARAGLMLEIENGKINGISFCYNLTHRENLCVFEEVLKEIREDESLDDDSFETFEPLLHKVSISYYQKLRQKSGYPYVYPATEDKV